MYTSCCDLFKDIRVIDWFHSIHISTPCNLQHKAFTFSNSSCRWYHNPLICFAHWHKVKTKVARTAYSHLRKTYHKKRFSQVLATCNVKSANAGFWRVWTTCNVKSSKERFHKVWTTCNLKQQSKIFTWSVIKMQYSKL